MLNYAIAPNNSGEAFKRWIEHGIMPGSFLCAVLENNLVEACGCADHINMHLLPAYANWLYNEAPGGCWGSKEKMEEWPNIREDVVRIIKNNRIENGADNE